MQTKHNSIYKIIVLLILLCMSVMASVMYYHYRNPQTPKIINNDQVTLFPTGIGLKPLILQSGTKTFTEQNFYGHWTLLFFGFTHCPKVCPTTMKMLSEAFPILQKQYPNLQVIFVSLDRDRDTPTIAANYAHRFHTQFIGTTSQIKELHKLQSQFRVFSQRISSANAKDYQIMHTTSIMLINPQAQWIGLFKYGLRADDLINAFKQAVPS